MEKAWSKLDAGNAFEPQSLRDLDSAQPADPYSFLLSFIIADHNGYVSEDEFKAMLGKLSSKHTTPKDVKRILQAVDTNQDGRIGPNEFKAAWGEMGFEKTKDLRKTLTLMMRMADKVQKQPRRKDEGDEEVGPRRSSDFMKLVAKVYTMESRSSSDKPSWSPSRQRS